MAYYILLIIYYILLIIYFFKCFLCNIQFVYHARIVYVAYLGLYLVGHILDRYFSICHHLAATYVKTSFIVDATCPGNQCLDFFLRIL